MIRKLVIIRVKAVILCHNFHGVCPLSWHRSDRREPELIQEERRESFVMETEDGERERKCVEEIQADRSEASSDTLIPITLIPWRYQIWGTWAGDGSLITMS